VLGDEAGFAAEGMYEVFFKRASLFRLSRKGPSLSSSRHATSGLPFLLFVL